MLRESACFCLLSTSKAPSMATPPPSKDANAVVRPTLQAVLWLSELVATTTLRKERATKRGPKFDQVVTTRAMHDIVAQAQVVLDQENADLITVTVVKNPSVNLCPY